MAMVMYTSSEFKGVRSRRNLINPPDICISSAAVACPLGPGPARGPIEKIAQGAGLLAASERRRGPREPVMVLVRRCIGVLVYRNSVHEWRASLQGVIYAVECTRYHCWNREVVVVVVGGLVGRYNTAGGALSAAVTATA